MSMTLSELIKDLQGYEQIGMGDELIFICVAGKTAHIDRTEPGDGLDDIYLLDLETP